MASGTTTSSSSINTTIASSSECAQVPLAIPDVINFEEIATGSATNPKSGKHKTTYDPSWSDKFPWVRLSKDSGRDVLLCNLCSLHHKGSSFKNCNWVNQGIITVRLDKIKEHSISEMHKIAVAAEMNEKVDQASEKDFGEESELFQAVKCAMKCLDFLISHNLPHTTLFEPLLDFCIGELHSPILVPLEKAKNASYRSYQTMNELLEAMSKTKEEEILKDINGSPFFSTLIDETSDINNRKHMAVVVKYLKDEETKISFVKDCHIPDGKADTIFKELAPIVEKCGNFSKMSGFTSDGASAMMGKYEGVATKVKEKNGKIITFNCLNHRIALAAKDTFEGLTRFVKLDELLTSTYKYYKKSSTRTNSLVNVQTIFGKGLNTTIKRVGFTRWLSHSNAINSIRVNYEAILSDLENAVVVGESSALCGPTASGLLKHFKSYEFFQVIHFMCDVMAVMTSLNLFFQRSNVDLASIEPNIENSLIQLKKLGKKPGGTFCKKLSEQARKFGIIAPIDQQSDGNFEKDARKFIDNLCENLRKRTSDKSVVTQLGILDLSRIGPDTEVNLYGNTEIVELAEFFQIDEDDLLEEWEEFKFLFLRRTDLKNEDLCLYKLWLSLKKSEQSVGKNFPNIQKLLEVSQTIAVSNAEVERIFSQVKIILNEKRNRLKMENVNKLLIIKMNPMTEDNFSNAVKMWKNAKKRRIFS